MKTLLHSSRRMESSVAFSPDGSRILSAADDKTLKLWDLAGNCLSTLQGHEDWVRSCAFSPDGSRILSAADDGLRLWHFDGASSPPSAANGTPPFSLMVSWKKSSALSWKMANFAKDGRTWTLDETGCFEWVPAQY